jgi:hypothetical protein
MNQSPDVIGFKFTLSGVVSWFVGVTTSIDLAQAFGAMVAIVGLTIQIASYLRGRDKDLREKIQHKAEMRRILAETLLAEAAIQERAKQVDSATDSN